MNNSINYSSPNFGAKINLGRYAEKFKNPQAVKTALEKATAEHPHDYIDFYGDNASLCIDYLAKDGGEQAIEFGAAAMNKLFARTKDSFEPFVKKMKAVFDTLKFGTKRQEEMDKLVNGLVEGGFIKDNDKIFDDIISEGTDSTHKLMQEKLAKTGDEVLMSGKIY